MHFASTDTGRRRGPGRVLSLPSLVHLQHPPLPLSYTLSAHGTVGQVSGQDALLTPLCMIGVCVNYRTSGLLASRHSSDPRVSIHSRPPESYHDRQAGRLQVPLSFSSCNNVRINMQYGLPSVQLLSSCTATLHQGIPPLAALSTTEQLQQVPEKVATCQYLSQMNTTSYIN